jgi:kynurenine formamidase
MRSIMTMSFAAVLMFAFGSVAYGQTWQPPSDSQRCPSKWGPNDVRGSANHMSPETVLRATKLIRKGEVFELGRVLSETMPMPVGRRFEIFTKRTRNDAGSNHRGSNEELIVAEMGHISSRTGFTKLGVETVGALMTRAVLIDVAALKGVDMLAETYEITVQDLQQALAAQKLTLQRGDAVLIHTGWGKLWSKDNPRYQRSAPGIGTAAAEWIAKQDPMLVGADNTAIEISPNPDKQLAGPVHQIMLVVNGIHLLENLRLDELAARRVFEFALIVEPLKIQGGTGSTVAPIAIH